MAAALGIMCKAPRPGLTKTRLAARLGPEKAARLSACFLKDVADVVLAVPSALGRQGYGIYAPAGSEAELAALLPPAFRLLLQEGSDFGLILGTAVRRLLTEQAHDCVVLINADSPTLPASLLTDTVAALRRCGDRVVLGPAIDGGYTHIGLKADHPGLFVDIPWSTDAVLASTLERPPTSAWRPRCSTLGTTSTTRRHSASCRTRSQASRRLSPQTGSSAVGRPPRARC
ncbi:hypothetical protein CTI14_10260 [Methylobacterium radiotolerans]|nr:hypothetical protein CTI14_10260 [Methylobacterium radiotolerans]